MKITEFKNYETRHVLLESLDKNNRNTYLLWESAGKQLKEAALTPQQIQGLFSEIEKSATAAGSNRTLVGQGLDKVNQVIVKPWNDLKAKIYDSGPMQGFAEKYDQAAEALKQKAGGDEGKVMQIVNKYRRFAEKHPIMQGFIYSALIAAAGISGAGLGGAAALGLFKLTDQLLQGKDIRSALYSAGKTGALAYGASKLGDVIRGADAATDNVEIGQTAQSQQGAFQGGGTDVASAFETPPNSIEQIVTDFDGKLSTDEMRFITDNGQQGIPQNVIDQYNAQLDNMYGEGGLELANFKPGDTLTNDQMEKILQLPNQDSLPNDVNDAYNAQLQSYLDGTDVNVAVDPDEVSGASGADRTASAQSGSVADTASSEADKLRAKADEFLPGGGDATIVRGNIPIYDKAQAAEFNRLFPGTEAMSPEAKAWLTTNVDGAAEKFDQAAAAQAERLKNLSPEQLARRKALLQSGHSTKNKLSEDQIRKLFIAVAYRNTLMEAPGVLSNLKKQIGKGVTALGAKAKQVGTNITTKVTADKLMKAWNKAGKPTDSVQIAQFLTGQGIDGAVLQQGFQSAGIKMPDLKKIASDDPVMALVQKIQANPAIKKQILQYLEAVT